MLDSAALREFEAAIGKNNVSDDPAIVTSYAWNTGFSGSSPSERLAPIKPVAIVLPGSTEEVQAIVKACLRHDIKFRARSTGTVTFSNVTQERAIAIDLRRMDKCEVDADNQMAVIEPYVTGIDLMTAAWKVGLTSHLVGAGWTHSPLASATSLFGIGITSNLTGQNSRNLLGYEWVTPQGDIVRGGAPGSGCGWFAGEGPGPGFRGVIRGHAGAMGALGVFTRIGYKLHPWEGPKVLEHTGQHPNYGVVMGDRMKVYQCVWPDWSGPPAAMYELMESKAATFVLRIPADHYGWTLAETNREYYDQRRTGTLPEIAREENRISWTLMTASGSVAEQAWRDRTIRAIVEKTGGRFLDLDPHHEAMMARNLITSSYVPRALRGGVCGSATTVGVSDSFNLMPKFIARGEQTLAPYKKKGGTFTEGDPEQFWIWPSEGRNVWAENIVPFDSTDHKGAADGMACAITSFEENDKNPIGNSSFMSRGDMSDIYGPGMGHFNDWMRKVKAALDPANASDGAYINAEPNFTARFWPLIRRFMFRSRWLLSFLMRKSLEKKKPSKVDNFVEPA